MHTHIYTDTCEHNTCTWHTCVCTMCIQCTQAHTHIYGQLNSFLRPSRLPNRTRRASDPRGHRESRRGTQHLKAPAQRLLLPCPSPPSSFSLLPPPSPLPTPPQPSSSFLLPLPCCPLPSSPLPYLLPLPSSPPLFLSLFLPSAPSPPPSALLSWVLGTAPRTQPQESAVKKPFWVRRGPFVPPVSTDMCMLRGQAWGPGEHRSSLAGA